MEEERESTRYWCHQCSRVVDPIMEFESIKCSLCQNGFVEEIDSIRSDHHHENDTISDSDRGISLWAPILLGMMNTPRRRRRRRVRQLGSDEENEEDNRHQREGGTESELDPEDALTRRRSATLLHLLQGIRAGITSESENNHRERVILVNPLSQTIIFHGGSNGGNPIDSTNLSHTHPFGSFGDFFLRPSFEQLLQHLSETDPNRYGLPPAQKEAVEAMPTVTIVENSTDQCCICLEEFDIGTEAREMPCKHNFHGDCILKWLDLHSSCPVCRYQMPTDGSKINQDTTRGNLGNLNEESRLSVSIPWPFSGLFSSSPTSDNNLDTSSEMTSFSGDLGSSPGGHDGDGREDSQR